MARVQPYERVVDAVVIHTSPVLDIEIQNGTKIKNEPIDTTSNPDTTEDNTIVRNCFSLIDHDYHRDKSLSKNDNSCKDINSTENRDASNSHNAHSNDEIKTVNIERKKAKKRKKCSNEISNNKNTSALCITEYVRKNKKQNSVRLDYKTKRQYKLVKKENAKCDICFRQFSSVRNCETHKQYYEFVKNNYCRICDKHYMTREKLQSHTCQSRRLYIVRMYEYNCNFCSQIFYDKILLQSHLFHVHNELICFNSTITNTSKLREISKSEIYKVNTSPKDNTLKTNANEESLCLNNLIKAEKINITLTNNINKSCDDSVIDTEQSKIEKTFNNEMTPTKRLRQPTLTEYLDLCKKKRDIKLNPNKLNIMKDESPTCTLDRVEIEENPRLKLFEEQNGQFDSLSTNKDNIPDNIPKQMASSIQKQSVKPEICLRKKPFVKLHADVEMMKSFLENLTDTVVKDKVTEDRTKNIVSNDRGIFYSLRSLNRVSSVEVSEDRTSDIVSYDRGISYNLRSLNGVSSVETSSNSEIRKNKNVSKKSPSNIEFSIKKEQNVIDSDNVDPTVGRKMIMAFKCKECTIPLIKCDEQPRNSNTISTIEAIKNTSFITTQCNFKPITLVQESDVRNKMTFKNLEVSLERLTAIPTIDIKTETLDTNKHNNNYFLCKVCKESFSSKLAKRVHIKSSHIAYMSSICDARYTLKHKLLEHYLREHLFKQNQCCICFILLPDYEALKQHLNVHCLKYIKREDDQYPVDIELKCNLIKKNCKSIVRLHCNKTFSSQSSLIAHQSCCTVQEEMKDEKNFMEETNAYSTDISEIQHKKKTNENIITCDESINSDDLSKPSNSDSVKKSNKYQKTLHSETELKLNEEINEANRKFLVNNNSIENKIESVNESQDPKKLLENDSSTISNQNNANTQLNDITTKSMTYPCDICGKQFHNPKNLELHIRCFSVTTDICPMCCTGFSSKRLLQTHITAAHVPQISKTYNFHCVFCNQGFFKKHDLRPHILHLHGQQVLNTLTRNPNMSQEKSDKSITHVITCNVCNLVFETHDRYVEHRMYYYNNHTFKCSICAQNFQGMYMYHHHNKLIHCPEDKRKSYNYICDICNEGFNHESHFYSHTVHVHSKEVNLIETTKESEDRNCNSSNVQEQIKNFPTNQQKRNEQLSNKYTCQICQVKCIDMAHMIKHKECYSNDGDFKCDKCNRRCKTSFLLDQHKKLTHFYRDIFNGHVCHICDEVLETVFALKCHEKHFHSNITNNNTDNSGQMSSSSNITYKIIERPHESKNNTSNTEYDCLFCDMKFSTSNAVQTHIVYVHMDDMIAKRTTLKLSLPIINNVDIQKQFVETVQVPSSSSSLSSSLASSSEKKTAQLLQNSTSSMIQQSKIILNNTMAKNGISVKTTELLKQFRAVHSTNKNTEKTSIPCIDRSKDNVLSCNTIASNTEPKTNISVSSSIGSTTRTDVPSTELGNNTSVPLSSGSTIFKTVVPNTASKNNTLISLSGSVKDLGRKCYENPLKSGSVNEFKANSSSNRSVIINQSKIAPVYLFSNKPLSTFKDVMPQSWKSNEITNQKSVSVNNYDHGYSCPLCPLEYPSLMFFQAHLKYAHADSIISVRTHELTIPQVNQTQKASMIECLLCPCTFFDETKYKKHLRNSHTYYVYIPNSEEMTKMNNVCNPPITQTNINRRSTIPETITIDDVNIKSTSDQGATEVTTLDHKKENEKIGKLRVKPFAKIIENLSTDSASKFL